MPERVNILHIHRALRKLAEAYHIKGKRDDVANVWIHVLADMEPQQLDVAVLAYLRTDSKWMPAPGQLLALANGSAEAGPTHPGGRSIVQTEKQKMVSHYHGWEQHHHGPCPVCGARLEALTPEERGWKAVGMTPEGFSPGASFGVLHDGELHRLAGVQAIGAMTT